MSTLNTQYFLGVRVDNLRRQQALDKVEEMIENNQNPSRTRSVFFVNVHSIFLSREYGTLKSQINQSDLVLGDGSGLEIAGQILNNPMRDNLNGTDFIPEVLNIAEQKDWSVYLLGAKEHVVKKCHHNLRKKYPGLHIAGYRNGYFEKQEEDAIIENINRKSPDILLIAMGSPLQENWISRYKDRLQVPVSFGVGGLFDFMAGIVPRAPVWMRNFGIEWMYRFIHQPKKKWDRVFIEIPLFIPLIVAKQKLPDKINSLF